MENAFFSNRYRLNAAEQKLKTSNPSPQQTFVLRIKMNNFELIHISIFFQVDLGEEHTLELIRTKGVSAFGSNSWITRFTIEYSQDGSTWYSVTSEGSPVEFSGNIDRTSPIENVFNPPITARYVRLKALAWQDKAACVWQLIYNTVCTGKVNVQKFTSTLNKD